MQLINSVFHTFHIGQFNQTSNRWYVDRKCPKPIDHSSFAIDAMIVLAVLIMLSGGSYGSFRAFVYYRQRRSYLEQIDTQSESETPPIYSW